MPSIHIGSITATQIKLLYAFNEITVEAELDEPKGKRYFVGWVLRIIH